MLGRRGGWERNYEVDFGTAGVALDAKWVEGLQVGLGVSNEQECLVRTAGVLSIGEGELKLEDVPSSKRDGGGERLIRSKAVNHIMLTKAIEHM